jgi:hypothetical protein
VLNQPTIFGMNGTNAMVGGEAGAEAIAPIDVLQKYVADAVRSQDHSGEIVKVLNLILEALYNLDETLVEKIVTALVNGVSVDWNDRNVARLVRSYVG